MGILKFFTKKTSAWLDNPGPTRKVGIEPHARQQTTDLPGRPSTLEAHRVAVNGKLVGGENGIYKAYEDRNSVRIVCIIVPLIAGIASGGLGHSLAGLAGATVFSLPSGIGVYRLVTAYYRNKKNKI